MTVNVVELPAVTELGEAENEVIVGPPPALGDTVRVSELEFDFLAASVTVTLTVKLPVEVGVQERVLKFWVEQPPGSPVYA